MLAEPHVDFVGEINEDEKVAFLGQARARCSRSTGPSHSAWS
jgi:hypothetical protein